jgi:biopolymer transport protein ExbD
MQNHSDINDDSADLSSISDINVTPFIDVMLVLLIIFMVTAPLMMGGVKINLPKTTGLPMARPDRPLIVSLDANNQVFVDKDPVEEAQRKATFKQLALDSETGEVFVRGDGEVKYSKMMELMSELGQSGFARVTLVTNVLPNKSSETGSLPGAPSQPGSPSVSSQASPTTSSSPTASPSATPTGTQVTPADSSKTPAAPSSADQATQAPVSPAATNSAPVSPVVPAPSTTNINAPATPTAATSTLTTPAPASASALASADSSAQ